MCGPTAHSAIEQPLAASSKTFTWDQKTSFAVVDSGLLHVGFGIVFHKKLKIVKI